LALKCFSTWQVFDLMKKYMDGTTSSSFFEAKLGKEKFGKETHAYNAAYSEEDIKNLKTFCDKIIFNSVSQLEKFYDNVKNKDLGLRINPSISYSHFDLANPAKKFSRLGIVSKKEILKVLNKINGVMFHYNCENNDMKIFSQMLYKISKEYEQILNKVEWVSLGGGVAFTEENYPIDWFCKELKKFSEQHKVQIYLEPGEAAITKSCELVTTVLDVVKNEIDIAIVDAGVETHMLDLLIYRIPAKINMKLGQKKYMITGKSCLAGDIFGTYKLAKDLKIGSQVRFDDAAGYTMVKTNWFNGLQKPSIVIKRLGGKTEIVKQFSYEEFVNEL
jgi:carboxynorspermidine decarboxylase